jgi:hypothetical protein
MNVARVAVQDWTLHLRGVLAGLGAARLRWCVVCGRVGLWGWQPLCAAMPITWACADRAGCRVRQARGGARQRPGCRLVAWRRPGLARPPTGRPWHPASLAVSGCGLHGPVSAAADPKQPAVLTRSRPDVVAAGRAGDRR